MKKMSAGLLTLVLLNWQTFGFADWKWNMYGTANESYDDNITFAPSNRLSDEVTRLSLGGGFTQDGKNEQVKLKTDLTEEIFARHSSFDNLAEDLSVDAYDDLDPYNRVEAHDAFLHSQEPRNFISEFGRISGRYSIYSNNLDMDYARRINEQWKAKVRYRQDNYIFSTNALSDSANYEPGVGMEYDLDSKTQLSAGYDYSDWVFTPGQQADIHTFTAGLRRYLTNQLYLDLKPGWNIIRDFNGKNWSKPRYEAGITDDVNETTTLNLSYVKEYSITPYTQDVFNNWHTALTLLRQITDRLKLGLSGFYGKGTYQTTFVHDTFSGAGISAEYALTKHTSVFCTYTYERENSNNSSYDYTHNVVLFGIKIAF